MRCAAVLALILLARPAAASSDFTLPALMQSLASVHEETARFTAQQTSPLLQAPLTTTGTLAYRAPDYMRKTTLTPVPEDFTLDGAKITMRGPDGKTHVFGAGQDPRIGGLVEAIRATLAGDLPALRRLYEVRLSGDAAHWRLVLHPRNAALASLVREMRISGGGRTIDSIDTTGPDGSESDMRIVVTDAR